MYYLCEVNEKLKHMNMKTVNFEKRNKQVSRVKGSIQYIANTAKTKQECVNRLSDILPKEFKVGFGGTHVWCSSVTNERLFIIFF